MYSLRVTTRIAAAPDVCFDLARSVDAHVISAADTSERAVGGKMSGLLELGDEVVWEGRHFGIMQRLSSRITQFRPPTFFQDRMTKGTFRSMKHDHIFEADGEGTIMIDVMTFAAPFGPLGWLLEKLLLGPHLRRFLVKRGLVLKTLAERQVAETDHVAE